MEQKAVDSTETLRTSGRLTKLVHLGEVAVTNATDERPKVGTGGLNTCIGIAIFDPDVKVGGVAHVYFDEIDHMRTVGFTTPEVEAAIKFAQEAGKPFGEFNYYARRLIETGEGIGGKNWVFYVFNVNSSYRSGSQNEQINTRVEEIISELKRKGQFQGSEFRKEQDFKLDTRTGLITKLIS
ncbi:MAG: hypothetical protein G01um10147_842 [Microgenomates group bacterium Gr01-1014_7]|nr:MAG: hypothetical protein G01um10147_842 [Microgenomates group bacterium Gr01-1014_7]